MSKPSFEQMSNVPELKIQNYERYLPSAFDESLSILQKINKMIYQLNHLGLITNDLIKQWDILQKWIVGSGLTDSVNEIITQKIDDGSFDLLFERIVGDLQTLDTNVKDRVVSAINEVNKITTDNNKNIGDITKLTTANKESIVSAIVEIVERLFVVEYDTLSIGEATSGGIISGFKVTQQQILSMAVEIGNHTDPNIVHMTNGVRFEMPTTAIPINNAHNTLNRIDLITVNDLGTIEYIVGNLSVDPIPPHIPNNHEPLAYIHVLANDTSINNNDIEDIRNLKSPNFLMTNRKNNLVMAINELVGMINENKTESSNDLTEAINSFNAVLTQAITKINDDMSNGFDKINEDMSNEFDKIITEFDEINTKLTSEIDKINTDLTNVSDVINHGIGDKNDLTTTNKLTIVSAINEVNQMLIDNSETINTDLKKYVEKDTLVYNVLDYKMIGDGVTDNTQMLLSLLNKIGSQQTTISFTKGNYLIETSVVIPSNVTLLFENNAMISTKENVKITINGEIKAGLRQIFSGKGEIVGSPLIKEVYPEWFGGQAEIIPSMTNSFDNYDAIVKASKISKTIVFKDGFYNVSKTITFEDSVNIKGNGRYTTTIRMLNSNEGAFVLKGTGSNISDIGFAPFDIPTDGHMIMVQANGCILENIWIRRCYIGISAKNLGGLIVNTINIDNYAWCGILCQSLNDVILSNFIFNAGGMTNGAMGGIRLMDRVEAFMASNGDILEGLYAITTEATENLVNRRPAYNRFTNVYFDSAVNGCLLNKMVSSRFTNCWISNRPNNGINVNDCDDLTFTNCEFTNNGGSGAEIYASNKRIKFIGCSFMNNNSENVGAHGLSFHSGSTDFIVKDCTASNSLGFEGSQHYGIFINAGESDRYIVSDNLVNGNVVGGIMDGGTGLTKDVKNNW